MVGLYYRFFLHILETKPEEEKPPEPLYWTDQAVGGHEKLALDTAIL
jgi:hypothetical protein